MAYGIRIVNDAGTVQIDETYAALCLLQKGTATFVQQPLPDHASGSFSKNEQQASITVTGANNPVMAIRSDYYCNIVGRTDNGGGSWTFLVDGEPASSGQAFDWYVFDNQPKITSEYGFAVKNAAGQLVFSMDSPPMRFTDLFAANCGTFTDSDNNANPQTFSYAAGRTYAFIPGRIANRYAWMPQSNQQVKYLQLCGGKSVSGGIGTARMIAYSYVFSNTSTPNKGWHFEDYDMLVIDVTNY